MISKVLHSRTMSNLKKRAVTLFLSMMLLMSQLVGTLYRLIPLIGKEKKLSVEDL